MQRRETFHYFYGKPMAKFQSVIPVLSVGNLLQSIEYYTTKLGFHLNWQWGEPPDFCSISRGDVEIFLCQGGQGQPGTWLCVNLDDVDSVYQEYLQSGALIAQVPTDYERHMREMLVKDLDGHCLRIGNKIQ